MDEKRVATLWKSKGERSYQWKDKQVDIIYPGRQTKGGGCDFEDAVFRVNGMRITGKVELHVKASGWFAHRHHLDPRYSEVALHVVLEDDNHGNTITADGRLVPTIVLKRGVGTGNFRVNLHCCRGNKSLRNFDNRIYNIIYNAAEDRMAAKKEKLKKLILDKGPEQVLYEFIARALGYSLNSAPFEKLAGIVTLNKLRSCALKASEEFICALLAGNAGLLASQHGETGVQAGDTMTETFEDCWSKCNSFKAMDRSEWAVYGIRPQNRPLRRIVALGKLLWRFRKEGFIPGVINEIKDLPGKQNIKHLHGKIEVPAEGYWAEHVDFGVPMHGKAALLGNARAADIVVNTVLPFACSYGELHNDQALVNRSRQIYYAYPVKGINQVAGYMVKLLGLDSRLNKYAEYQGLIHIYGNYCRQKLCDLCPVTTLQN